MNFFPGLGYKTTRMDNGIADSLYQSCRRAAESRDNFGEIFNNVLSNKNLFIIGWYAIRNGGSLPYFFVFSKMVLGEQNICRQSFSGGSCEAKEHDSMRRHFAFKAQIGDR